MNKEIKAESHTQNRIKLTKEQSSKIQILRGLAIVAVVFIHSAPTGFIQVWFRPFANFCVGLFLFISGLLSCAEHWNPGKRIKKVAIPYCIWTLIYVIIANILKSPSSIPLAYFKALILANAAAPMYFIFVYCEFVLLIPLIDKLAKSKYVYLGFFITPIEILAMRYLPLYLGLNANEYIEYIKNISCLGWFTYFYIGYIVGNGILRICFSTKSIFIAWCTSIVLQVAEAYCQYLAGAANCGTQFKLTSVLSGVLFALMAYKYLMNSRASSNFKILKMLGDNSFGIFFSHMAVILIMNHLPYYRQYAVFPLNAIVTILVTFICVEILKIVFGKYGKYLALY